MILYVESHVQEPSFFSRQVFQKYCPGVMICPSGMVSLTSLANKHGAVEPSGGGAVGGEKVGGDGRVGVASLASGADVGPASAKVGVEVASAICVSCAATVIATAVVIEGSSAPVPPQETVNSVKNIARDRKMKLLSLFILIPFGKHKRNAAGQILYRHEMRENS